MIFCGIDTSICVETSLRDGFNRGYDVILVSDCTASNNSRHYQTTIEHVKEYYGIVMTMKEVIKLLKLKSTDSLTEEVIKNLIFEKNLLNTSDDG